MGYVNNLRKIGGFQGVNDKNWKTFWNSREVMLKLTEMLNSKVLFFRLLTFFSKAEKTVRNDGSNQRLYRKDIFLELKMFFFIVVFLFWMGFSITIIVPHLCSKYYLEFNPRDFHQFYHDFPRIPKGFPIFIYHIP